MGFLFFMNNTGIQNFEKEQNKNRPVVLITGGAGFIGSNLCRKLLEKNYQVMAVDNLITGRVENISPFLSNPNFYFFNLDINNPLFKKVFLNISLNFVFHLACPTGVPNIKKLSEEMIRTNSIGTLNVAEIAKQHKASLLFSSSAEVYGQPEVTPQSETYNGNVNPVGERSCYEEGKRFSESILKMYADKFGVNVKIVRIFNTYGPGMSLSDQRVMPQFLKSIISGKNMNIYGNGEQTRTFLYIDDLIKGLLIVMEKGSKGEVYNIGGKRQIPIKELAFIIKKITHYQNGVSFSPHFIEDHRSRQPLTEKIEKLGWKQEVSLEEGLKKMIAANGIKIT